MSAYGDERSENWATFVAVLFVLVGSFNLIEGLVALVQDDYFVADELLFGDLAMWGLLFTGIGVLQLVTGFLIFRGSAIGTLMGVVVVSFNAIVTLLSIGGNPIWSVIILVLDGVVIYALTVYGTDLVDAR